MDCDQVRKLLDSYLDGELDLVRSLDLESHLEGCANCSAAHRAYIALRGAINSPAQYHRAPDSLERRIRSALRSSVGTAVVEPPPRRAGWRVRWFALAASIAVVFVLLWQFASRYGEHPQASLESELLAGHVRSLMPGHLTDLESREGHDVKPWFAGKLDFSPRVADLSLSGFPLVGSRLDYIGGRPVAVIVYQRRKHLINLFTWPSGAVPDRNEQTSTRQGYNSVHWVRSGFQYWAMSDLNEAELKQFAQLFAGK